ncbi:MAG TPA: hypothetical protein P5244_06690 [Syntrophales bacterium]|nr:hypothetical protein [Syntrophobacterales bacterium]HRR40902.1 hypothetical protein [Syntrophales bacterium]HRT27112.1 hypothetical protein [Syntrophales bacterium]HRT71526.1 hypothetical protein [Syntrophales bacterium]
MTTIMPEGEEVQKAIKWISQNLEENPNQPLIPLVEKAVFKFDLSPKDSEFLMTFFRKRKSGGQ